MIEQTEATSATSQWRPTFTSVAPGAAITTRLSTKAPSEFAVNVEPMTGSVSTMSEEEWHLLTELFDVRDPDVTRWMLTAFFELRANLYELIAHVWSLFGRSTNVRLEYLPDEDTTATGELFAVILATQPYENARELLEALDASWWLEASARVGNCLNVVVVTQDA